MRVLSIAATQIRLWRDIQEQRVIPVKNLATIEENKKYIAIPKCVQ